jgi:hypothetical protein
MGMDATVVRAIGSKKADVRMVAAWVSLFQNWSK